MCDWVNDSGENRKNIVIVEDHIFLFWYSDIQFDWPDCAMHDRWMLPIVFVLEPIKESEIKGVFGEKDIFFKCFLHSRNKLY